VICWSYRGHGRYKKKEKLRKKLRDKEVGGGVERDEQLQRRKNNCNRF